MSKEFFGFSSITGSPVFTMAERWQYYLIAIGSASSLIYPHVPLVSFATIAGITLGRQQATVTVVVIWLVNQFYGFTVRHYPLSAMSLGWGLTMGFSTVLVAWMAAIFPTLLNPSWRWIGQALRSILVLLLGFTIYQSGILLVNQWVRMHGLTAAVLLRILTRELLWTVALFSFYSILVLVHQQRLRQTSRWRC